MVTNERSCSSTCTAVTVWQKSQVIPSRVIGFWRSGSGAIMVVGAWHHTQPSRVFESCIRPRASSHAGLVADRACADSFQALWISAWQAPQVEADAYADAVFGAACGAA